jgi:hypothetical protein
VSRLSRPIRTCPGLWAGIAFVAFVLLGFVNWLPESKGSAPVWDKWTWTVNNRRWDWAPATLVYTLFIALLATGIGWLGQAVVGGILAAVRAPAEGGIASGTAGPTRV